MQKQGMRYGISDAPNGCITLSEHEADIVLHVLNAERSARLLGELQGRREDDAATPPSDRPYKVSELAILGHEIILSLRDQIETTREAGAPSVDVNFAMLACGFLLRSGLCGNDGDDAVIASLLDRAASSPARFRGFC